MKRQEMPWGRSSRHFCSRCLRGVILDYFGQPHAQQCGNCGICCSTFRQQDITTQAQMILSCVLRIHKQLGYYVGYTLVVRTLSGSREQRVQSLRAGRFD